MKMKLKMVLAAAVMMVFTSAGGAATFYKSKVIFSKGPDTWVKVTKAGKKVQPLEHPRNFTAEQMETVLAGDLVT